MIPKELLNLTVSSREELIADILGSLGERVERVIDSHNTASVIVVYRSQKYSVLLKAEFGSQTATHKEIGWYRYVEGVQLDHHVRPLDFYAGKTYGLLLLEYIHDSSTVDELVFEGKITPSAVEDYIEEALLFDRTLFNASSIKVTSARADVFFRGKYRRRRAESERTPYLRDLLSSGSVVINGREYIATDKVMRRLEATPSLLELLTPRKVGLIHGDLHCGNMLVNEKGVFFIDPNGNSMMPIEYDIGKILHSIHGGYGAIMRGGYTLHKEASAAYHFDLDPVPVYESTLSVIRKSMSDNEYLRGLYAEALHFATMLPHHAREEEETTALFLRSTQLFNELLDKIV